MDEALGSGYMLEGTHIIEQGNYLCIHEAGFPLHVYRLIEANEKIHPTVARLEHNGRSYRLELIEDEKW